MKKYKVVGSSQGQFLGIEMNIVFDDITMGKSVEVFGKTFTITQTGKIIILSNKDWVLTLQEVPTPIIDPWTKVITNPSDLRINHEVDVFLKTKLIKLSDTDRLKKDHGVTLLCLFQFLQNEWKYIGAASGIAFPFEYDPANKIFIMRDEWNFDSLNSISLFREGSFTRYNSSGRCI